MAEDRAGEREERGVDRGVAFVAGPQAAEGVQVRAAAFDDPALGAEPGAVFGAALCDDGLDPAGPEQSAVFVVVIAAVGEEAVGLATRAAGLAGDRSGVQQFEQRDQLRDVVAVAASERDRERDPGRVNEAAASTSPRTHTRTRAAGLPKRSRCAARAGSR